MLIVWISVDIHLFCFYSNFCQMLDGHRILMVHRILMLDLHHERHVGTSSAVDFLIYWKPWVLAVGTLMLMAWANLSCSPNCPSKAPSLRQLPRLPLPFWQGFKDQVVKRGETRFFIFRCLWKKWLKGEREKLPDICYTGLIQHNGENTFLISIYQPASY